MTTIVLATGNSHKVGEIRSILGGQFDFKTLKDFPGAPKTIEDAPTFSGNATKKAVELARHIATAPRFTIHDSRAFVLADDSGLEADALNGAPGVHSARYAATDKTSGNASDAANRVKLLRELRNVPAEKRAARFRCVIALTPLVVNESKANSPVCYSDEFETLTELFDGVCEGKIIFEERGKNGFGYDSLFVPKGFDKTFAELSDVEKNQLSHRAKALEKLRQFLNKPPN